MQISLKQAELEEAVRDYVAKCGISGKVGKVTFTATRGADGVLTEVEVGPMESVKPTMLRTMQTEKVPETPAEEEDDATDPAPEGVAEEEAPTGKTSLFS